MNNAVIAAGRFGLGARPGELAKITTKPKKWLLDQLEGPTRQAPALTGLAASPEVLRDVQAARAARRADRRAGDRNNKAYGRLVRRHYVDQVSARYRVAAETDVPFYERLVHFWSNHFAISADKQPLPAIAGLYENEAIRPNIAGRFVDLLLAVEKHPAMLLYLDNQRSVGPNSTLGRKANRRRPERTIGLNENLAREILELHTVGVDGGYTQADVTTFAAVITGWSVGGVNERGRFSEGVPGTFEFREAIHEPGSKTVMGTTYVEKGLHQGMAVLHDLAMQPSTARHLSEKLARHFIADDPPVAAIDRLTAAYLNSGGDLTTVYTALVDEDAVWQQTFAKYKSPHDFFVSTLRALSYEPGNEQFIIGALDLMGQTPYRPGSPAGWPDTADHWGGADGLYKRIEWSNSVARTVGPQINPARLGSVILGSAFNPETEKAILRAESVTQGMTLFLASPDFQRR